MDITQVSSNCKEGADVDVTFKVCISCKKRKSLSDFSTQNARNAKKVRYNSKCKSCKAKENAERRRKKREPKTRLGRCIEPRLKKEKKATKKAPLLPVIDLDKDDFRLWDKVYGRELTEDEQIEIKSNLLAFATILGDEHNQQTGDYVELSKDK